MTEQGGPSAFEGPYLVDNGACPYLPDRTWKAMYLVGRSTDAGTFERLLAMGFRRSGIALYVPWCGSCRECVSIRLPVASFRPSPDQKRALKKNRDVRTEVGLPSFSPEKLSLYQAFIEARYPGRDPVTYQSYHEFLVDNLGLTREFRYYVGERLVGVGIVDLTPHAASSVYFYFDPAESWRSLGTFSALREIVYCRETGRDYLYLGFRVAGCGAMAYKSKYRPHELMQSDGAWVPEERFEPTPPDVRMLFVEEGDEGDAVGDRTGYTDTEGDATMTHDCPSCGMPSNRFSGNAGKGYEKEGQTYCCRGCADGTGCTCV